KFTRLMLPIIMVIVEADVVAEAAPPQLVARETVMWPGTMIPKAGKPEPVAFTKLTPATPLLGAVATLSFTVTPTAVAHEEELSKATHETRSASRTRLLSDSAALSLAQDRRLLASANDATPAALRIQDEGSGTAPLDGASVALMITLSPSCIIPPPPEPKRVAVKPGRMLGGEESNNIRAVGLKTPVRVASTGIGLVPPMGISPPSQEIPSSDK